jgi:hypothetical protein
MLGERCMLGEAVIKIAAIAILLIAAMHGVAWYSTAAAAPDLMAQAVVARDTFACQSPWQVIESHECRVIAAGTQVNVVGGDDFFACVVQPGMQRCMWISREVLRKP